jgi:hypothetical protein
MKMGSGLWECPKIQAPTSLEECKEVNPNHSQMKNILVVLFLGMKVHIVNMVQIGPPIYHWEALEALTLKVVYTNIVFTQGSNFKIVR